MHFVSIAAQYCGFALITLLPLVNPVAFAPFFQKATVHCTDQQRRWIANRVAVYCTVLMLSVLFLGTFLLQILGISLPFLQMAGGILVAKAGWEALKPEQPRKYDEKTTSDQDFHTLAFFPLTLPITVGPGAIAAILGLAVQAGQLFTFKTPFITTSRYTGIIIAVFVAAILIRTCYAYATNILNKLGKTGTTVVYNLSSLVILTIGIQIFWAGAKVVIKGV